MNLLQQFKPIKLFALDVDGVLTNGNLLLLSDGQMARTMNIRDGFALQLAVKKGYHFLIITGGKDTAVQNRLQKLGIKNVFLGVTDKSSVLLEYVQKNNLNKEEVLFMGDDLPDLKVMQMSGLPCCPADACPEIKAVSLYISSLNGGEGCVRDVIEKVLKLNGHWDDDSNVAAI
ncbi:MAG: HAD-IIIA family hydrolase [Ferruginibacter sp.]|nr:HAD-IIIA family hydrolase [Ferruginibacter sp.]